jgi:BlaI family penicillinase repressor
LGTERPTREYIFKPLITARDCRVAASRSFLEKVFDGEIAPFLACFLERKKLTRKEMEELKKSLEEKSP